MSGYNMPPGVSPQDIPGNDPESIALELVLTTIENDIALHAMTADEAALVWAIALTAWKNARGLSE